MDTKKASPFMGWLIEKEVEEKCTLQEIAEFGPSRRRND